MDTKKKILEARYGKYMASKPLTDWKIIKPFAQQILEQNKISIATLCSSLGSYIQWIYF